MSRSHTPKVAIIGAGLSGLTCARELSRLGFTVTVFDKGQVPGGRASTRYVELSDARVGFDHGAQYFTVHDPFGKSLLKSWIEHGVARRWEGRVAVLAPDGRVESHSEKPRFVGTPGMSALGEHLSNGLDVRTTVHIGEILRENVGWSLLDVEGRNFGSFSRVIVTAPPSQSAALLANVAPAISARVAAVEMKPCWAVMAAFEEPVSASYDGAFLNHGPLRWAARTSSKPDRIHRPDRWVFHAGPAWSSDNIELGGDEVATQLLDAAAESISTRLRDPMYLEAHRWRYAIADDPLDDGALYDPELEIGACGDWACGNRIEGAILSGVRMARLVEGSRPMS